MSTSIDTAIGHFKRAAIDAYMRRVDKAGWRIDGDHYQDASSRVDITVSRPGENGNDGGHKVSKDAIFWFDIESDDYVSVFDGIRADIDAIVSPWRDIPDSGSSTFATAIDDVVDQSSLLAITPIHVGAHIITTGQPATLVKLIDVASGSLKADTITAFRDNFLLKVGQTLGGLSAASAARLAALVGEQAIWEGAEQDLATAIEKAATAMSNFAEHGSGKASFTAKLVDQVGDTLVPYWSDISGFVEIVVEEVSGGKPKEASVGSYDEGIQALKEACKTVNESITAQEQAIATQLTNIQASMGKVKDFFDLQVPYDTLGAPGAISHESAILSPIYRKHLPDLGTEMLNMSSGVYQSSMYSVSARDSSLGMGSYGPSAEYSSLNTLLYNLILELRDDCVDAAKSLEIYDIEMDETEADAQKRSDELHEEMLKDSTYSPW